MAGSFTAGETITFTTGATATVVSFGSSTIQAKSFSNNSFAVGDTVTGGTSGATGTTSTVSQAFTGGDKDITNIRDAYSALATEIKRLKGTSEWMNVGYGSISGVLNQIDSVITANVSATSPTFGWDGSHLSWNDSSLRNHNRVQPPASRWDC